MTDARDTTESKQWITLSVDDKPIGIFVKDSAAHLKEADRLYQLEGISWRMSREEDLQRFKKTIIAHELKKKAAAEKRAARRG